MTVTMELADVLTAAARRWEDVAFRTGPADRPRAEAGVRLAYRAAGLAEPEKIIWVDSPAAGARAIATLGAGRSVRDEVRTRPWERVRAEAHAALGPVGWPLAWALTGGRLWAPVNGLVTRIRQAVAALEESEADGAALRASTLDAVLGQQDAPWLSLFDALDRPEMEGLAQVAGSAGWWWPFERVAIVCERPAELHRDELSRLHRADGPALLFPDGFAVHAWGGMPVPADFAASMAALTPERIRAEDNAELRRVMLEHFGYDRYLAESGATPLHQDETGILWRIDLPDDEPVVMVEVVNSTAEPDGTFRKYWLRVPPGTRTARAGVAWTFGMSEADYRPERET
ncbi:hypothetical protein GCM10010156_04980 [Planobispora rosea]|uniref:DUF6745 domain-containing protein n=1 Tax=Planobispora rosea TaxID=35762 RepID=A0A8J3RXT9_PLARO|nr:hypothetical protein [Planobispora rosea]GGS49311.1 hypothetical protein GCM10010156_04980 [Planobispora rosea]GIH83782.1 hypothetical protein Pro02_21900 [Planobispora rosea]